MTVLQAQTFWLLESMYLEIFLVMAIVILLGAAGYTLFFCSILDDRRDMRRKNREKRMGNPWEQLTPTEEPPHRSIDQKSLIFGLVLLGLAVIAIIMLVILLIGK